MAPPISGASSSPVRAPVVDSPPVDDTQSAPAPAPQEQTGPVDRFEGRGTPQLAGRIDDHNREFQRLPQETRDRVRSLETGASRDAQANLARIATSAGFNQLPAERQREVLDAYQRHPEDRAASTELTTLANNPRFRGLDAATQSQAIGVIGAEGGGTSTARVVGTAGFERLAPASQHEMLSAVAAHPRDAAVGTQLTQLAQNSHFAGLPPETQTQVASQVTRHGAANQAVGLATQLGFGGLPRARQEQMLNVVDAHPDDARLSHDLAQMANSGTFRGVPEASQQQAIDLVAQHGAGSAIPTLATSRGFGAVGRDEQEHMLNGMHQHPTDTRLAQEYSQLGTNARFAAADPASQTQAIDAMGAQGAGTTIPHVVTAPGFSQLPRARQEQLLTTATAHPRDTAMGNTLAGLAGNARFRSLPDATQQQLVTMVGAGHTSPAAITLATSEDFGHLSAAHQAEMLTQIDGHPGDARVVSDFADLAATPSFRALGDASQTRVIGDIATQSPAAHVAGLDEAAILARGNTADGAAELRALGDVMRRHGVTGPERQQLNRIEAATFTPGVGMVLNGSAADQASFTGMVRREMLRSPAFHRLMTTQNADAAHPLNLSLGRNQPGHYVDAFNGHGNHTFDLHDLEQWPDTAPAGSPDAMTQGENLMHGLFEARQGALGNGYDVSHRRAIVAENEYRRDIGQASQMRLPPNDTIRNAAGNTVFQFNNGYGEETTGGNNVTGIIRHNPPPPHHP